jgi:hypothetical protein
MSPKTNKTKGVFIMKTVLLSLLLAVCLFAQGAPSANANGYSYDYQLDRNIGLASFDTLGVADSAILLASTISLPSEYEYILRVGVTAGSGSDSVALKIRASWYSGTTFLYNSWVDTVVTATGEQILLPFNRSGWADKVGLKVLSEAAAQGGGGQMILNNWSIIKRKYNK